MFTKLVLDDFRIFKKQTIIIGEHVTAIAGHNASGKSNVLGILGNACELKSKFGTTITDKQFKTEFSEIFRGSKQHDKASGNIGKIFYKPYDSEETSIGLRVTWQKWDRESSEKNRFRILPSWFDEDNGKNTARKLEVPSFYLGLSRLYPIGEDSREIIEERKYKNKLTDSEKDWLFDNYTRILTLDADIESISNYEIHSKRSGGVNTSKYDYLSNSAGQDNLMQILYLILSFIKLYSSYQEKEEPFPGGILLIDEIDAALHPIAQIRLIDLIYDVCRQFNFQSVFTTHSLQILEYLKNMQNRNSGISINYFITANDCLQIHTDPSFETMKTDMLISSHYQDTTKREILVYSEDDEARFLINHFLRDYSNKLRILGIKLGGESLMDLLCNDPDYFKNVLFILDGDKSLSGTKYSDLPRKYCNILHLPGGVGPEELIYNYLINLPPTHKILSENLEKGLSIRFFREHGPYTNPKYSCHKVTREKFKSWFNDNRGLIEDARIIEHWMKDNKIIVDEFINSFIYSFNVVAGRSRLPRIDKEVAK